MNWEQTVSYTHLDVYKRQAMNMTLFVVEEAIYTLQMELVKTYGEINNIPFFIAYVGVLLCRCV